MCVRVVHKDFCAETVDELRVMGFREFIFHEAYEDEVVDRPRGGDCLCCLDIPLTIRANAGWCWECDGVEYVVWREGTERA